MYSCCCCTFDQPEESCMFSPLAHLRFKLIRLAYGVEHHQPRPQRGPWLLHHAEQGTQPSLHTGVRTAVVKNAREQDLTSATSHNIPHQFGLSYKYRFIYIIKCLRLLNLCPHGVNNLVWGSIGSSGVIFRPNRKTTENRRLHLEFNCRVMRWLANRTKAVHLTTSGYCNSL